MQVFVCKHCGEQVPGELEACPECYPDGFKRDSVPLVLVIVLLCSSFLMVGSSYVNVKSFGPATSRALESDLRASAYLAAQDFVNQQHPKERIFSDFDQSQVQQSGNRLKVTLLTTEASGNQPVRNFYYVELERSGEAWKLVGIAQ